jgi:putative radical SAM enzyme (TIGR03279 family)
MSQANTIKYVYPGSIAQDAGLEEGDIVTKVNGKKISDILEFRFITADEEYELTVLKKDGSVEILTIINEYNEELGIEFEKPLLSGARSCSNNCIFCFIDQMPPGMRETLYFKDDDSRLSFLQGNYVTLTNMSDKELDKIVEMHLSPINVSVHCTNPEKREFMLGNKRAGKILSQMKRLCDAGITLNCQIVACPGINDGDELENTLKDLSSLMPDICSVSVVPVGITKYRQGLYDLKSYTKEEAEEVISIIEKWQNIFTSKFNSRIVCASDEFYITAKKEFPSYEMYEDFPQLENGVGMVSVFKEEFYASLKEININKIKSCTLVTGVIFADILKELVNNLSESIKVVPIINKFFGEKITVAGLVTGNDLINQLKEINLGEFIVIPRCMLRADTEVFLDDVTISDVEKQLNTKVYVSDDAYSLLKIITQEEK